MHSLFQDLKFGLRMLSKQPGLSFVAVLALGLGIGLTTVMFSIVYGALFRGLPFEESERLMHLERANLSANTRTVEVPQHDFEDWQRQQTSFEGLAGFYNGTVNLTGPDGRPERFSGGFVSANTFDLLRSQPALGRTFLAGEDDPGSELVVLLGHRLWRDRFAADPEVLGETVRVNGEQATVVGVMPEGFAFPLNQEVWVPLRQDSGSFDRGEGITLEVFGRLADGVSVDQAATEMATIADRLALEYPETNEGVGVVMKTYIDEFMGDELQALLFTMLGAVFGVLLIACANVANLLLARSLSRAREVAVRSVLGASRFRVVRQMLVETLVLSSCGAVLGLALSVFGVRMFNRFIADTDPPFWIDIQVDASALAFTFALVVVASLAAGLMPALRSAKAELGETLKDENRGTSSLRLGRLGRGLVMAEIAVSCALLVGAGLMIKSIVELRQVDYPFPTEDVFTARIGLFETDYPEPADRQELFEKLEERLGAFGEHRAVGLTTDLPASGSSRPRIEIEGETYEDDQGLPRANYVTASPGFFEVFEAQPLAGRLFTAVDHADAPPVVLVNESFVAEFFPGESALGRRLRLGPGDTDDEEPWREIVGVVPDLLMNGVANRNPAGIYHPLAQTETRFVSLAIRSATGDPMALTPKVRRVVTELDSNLPIYNVRTLPEMVRANTWFVDVFGSLFVAFGAAALFLATIGLYAVMAFTVRQRTAEMGIRMALGAKAADIVRLVLRQGLVQIGIGLGAGLVLAVGFSKLLANVLFRVEPWDGPTFVLVTLVLLLTGLVACLIPSRRASRVDPMHALRFE